MNDVFTETDLNRPPETLRKVHVMGVCGTAMAALAGMLKEVGLEVTGSDQAAYPPMSLFLEKLGITVRSGYGAENLDPDLDLAIVGNVIRRDNPEAVEMRRRGLPFLSLPQALSRFFIRDKRSIVVTGTHGKTTTSAMAAWMLEHAGLHPGFMIGGISSDFGSNYQVGKGDFFVTEGDEYDTAYFDKGPKFLHYKPELLIVNNIEFDHADIYRDLDHIKSNFRLLLNLLPEQGLLIANHQDPAVRSLFPYAKSRIETFSMGGEGNWAAEVSGFDNGFMAFDVRRDGARYGRFHLPMVGEHNVRNALAVLALGHAIGLDPETMKEALRTFKGVRRRQEIRGIKKGVIVMDDFAHHPTEVRETVRAVRSAYPERRLVSVFEPRTNTSRRDVFQAIYPQSFEGSDLILIREPPDLKKVVEGERFSSRRLVEDLKTNGKQAYYFPDTDAILEYLRETCREGDLVLIMSNGGFDGIHGRLLELL
ncbi:MAG: UDP-N-acetylmuramate:L-alanyl-gamma-D-glutamyl-meso-diaminopimelate ligase [Deltaproteobacteria bacterium]|nr:UDP-N-acetylmuramate:L-alanyl-gamma-D-glutamyl-meso-diaminopimelate ligase [Deltaproteobacteria bacterium]